MLVAPLSCERMVAWQDWCDGSFIFPSLHGGHEGISAALRIGCAEESASAGCGLGEETLTRRGHVIDSDPLF